MRQDNWQADLSDLIRARQFEPFDIVKFNCLMWACEGVKAVNGDDHYKVFDGMFKTVAGAAKQLRKKGSAETSAAYLESKLGERLHRAFIKKGDLIVIDPETTLVDMPSDVLLFGAPVGICYGTLSYFVGADGLLSVHTLSLGLDTYGFSC